MELRTEGSNTWALTRGLLQDYPPPGGELPVGTPFAVAMSGGVDRSMAAALLLEWDMTSR